MVPSRKDELQRAKATLLAVIRGAVWLRSVGIGEVEGEPGLVVGVAESAKDLAKTICAELDLEVPVRIRGQGEISVPEPEDSDVADPSFEALRKRARALLDEDPDER